MSRLYCCSALPWLTLTVVLTVGSRLPAEQAITGNNILKALGTIQKIGAEGQGYEAAQQASEHLRNLPSDQLFAVLEAMQPGQVVANNWLRGLASDIVNRSGLPDQKRLQQYLNSPSKSRPGRAMAYDLWKQADPDAAQNWVLGQLDDPSLLIREAAVARALDELPADDTTAETKTLARAILQSARHPKQVNQAIKRLDQLGEKVTEAEAFRMVLNWHAIGPFDNRGGIGFDEVYPPEQQFAATGNVDLQAEVTGKNGPVSWQPVTGSEDNGMVDLAAAYDKEKGAVAYVYTEFESADARTVEARLGCICANQAWLNGKQIMSNEVYHSGTMVDQYVAECELQAGTNRILLKICQNEQTESWAQDWDFRFRLTDLTGKGLVSQ